MGEKLLSERDAYELADILNAKGIDKFAEMAENIARNQTIENAIESVLLAMEGGYITVPQATAVNSGLEILRKQPSQESV